MLAVELEVLAKKFDRFGWDRDRGSAAHDRLITDWMDALQDYPLDEVKAACRAVVAEHPNRMPNEGHILAAILSARKEFVARRSKPAPERLPSPPPVTPQRARQIAEAAGLQYDENGNVIGFKAKAMPKGAGE